MKKFLTLLEEDEKLLLHLHQHVYLSREFIEKHIYSRKKKDAETDEEKVVKAHEISVFRRLSQLVKAGYITKFPLPITPGSGRPSNVYTLAQFGVDTVEDMTGIVHWQKKWCYEPQIWYMHALALADVVKSFEVNAPPGTMKVKQFISEAKGHFQYYEKDGIKNVRHVIRPDGILIIGHPDTEEKNMGIMVEMERTYADKTGTIRKLNQYNHFFGGAGTEKYKNRMEKFDREAGVEYPVKEWRILFVGDTESIGNRILNQLKGLSSIAPLRTASKEDLLENPYRKVYRRLTSPDELNGL